jgi:hypothetical protein
MTIVIEYADGRVSEYIDEQQARDQVEREYPDAVFADQWDAAGHNDEGEPMERLLVWSCEADAVDDAGAKAVCQLTRVCP